MVKLFYLFTLWGFFSNALVFSFEPSTASDWKLKLVFSKDRVFEGEQVTAQYFLETQSDARAVEIEVMKFPEFRSFWSENTLLRQGPIQLFSFPQAPRTSGVLMGSYVLYPMLNAPSRSMNPLKLLVKSFSRESVALLSEGSQLEILPLPPIPSELKGTQFFGGVGSFTVRAERPRLPYRLNQPFRLEVALEGEGNFSEINKLHIEPPPSCTFISEASFMDFFRGRNKKLFQWTMSCEEELVSSYQPADLLFFDPQQKRYQRLSFPVFSFNLLPEFKWENEALLNDTVDFHHSHSTEADWPELKTKIWFWGFQIAVLLLMIFYCSLILFQRKRREALNNPLFKRRDIIKKINRALKNENFVEFLFWTANLGENEIKSPVWHEIPPHEWKPFISAYQEVQFSPKRQSRLSFEDLREKWQRWQAVIKP